MAELPTFDELEGIRDLMMIQRNPRNALESLMFPQPERGEMQPFHPLQRYDYLEAYRQGAFGPDPDDANRIHGDSRFKSPDHPTRFGADRPGVVVDRITNKPIDVLDENQMNHFYRALLRAFGYGDG